ncbi:MAG: hypothetical protein AB8F78_10765 [Saprospiraceae bacterium]
MPNHPNINVGCVIYTLTEQGMNAEWVFNRNGKTERGTGVAVRLTEIEPERKFEGSYDIVYTNSAGQPSPSIYLTVSLEDGCYTLIWNVEGKPTDQGIGLESDGKLVASWTEVV